MNVELTATATTDLLFSSEEFANRIHANLTRDGRTVSPVIYDGASRSYTFTLATEFPKGARVRYNSTHFDIVGTVVRHSFTGDEVWVLWDGEEKLSDESAYTEAELVVVEDAVAPNAYVEADTYPTTFAGQTPDEFFLAHCEHPAHGHLVMNSGIHYSTRESAQRRLDEHLEEEHGIMRPALSFFATVHLLHPNCVECLREAESAAIMARVTGSVAGTSETVNPEGVPDHAATVSDRITTPVV